MVHTDITKNGDKITLHIDSNSCLNLITFVLEKESYIYAVVECNYHEQSSLFEDQVINAVIDLKDLKKIEGELNEIDFNKIETIELGTGEEQPIVSYNQLTNLIDKLIKKFILKSDWKRFSN